MLGMDVEQLSYFEINRKKGILIGFLFNTGRLCKNVSN